MALGKWHVALLGLLDLSAAFDTVNHDVLPKQLKVSFGVCSTPFKWMKSYVVGRTQTVIVNRSKSSMVKLSCCIPQGSLLEPSLFVLYTKDISAIIRPHGLWNHCYANDTKVYFHCKHEEVNSLNLIFSACIDDLCGWIQSNRLKLNADKTECVWVTTRQQQSTFTAFSLTVGWSVIVPSKRARNLGVFFGSKLDLKSHISNICRTCYFQLRQLRTVRRSQQPEILMTLLHALVSCRLDYCNSL